MGLLTSSTSLGYGIGLGGVNPQGDQTDWLGAGLKKRAMDDAADKAAKAKKQASTDRYMQDIAVDNSKILPGYTQEAKGLTNDFIDQLDQKRKLYNGNTYQAINDPDILKAKSDYQYKLNTLYQNSEQYKNEYQKGLLPENADKLELDKDRWAKLMDHNQHLTADEPYQSLINPVFHPLELASKIKVPYQTKASSNESGTAESSQKNTTVDVPKLRTEIQTAVSPQDVQRGIKKGVWKDAQGAYDYYEKLALGGAAESREKNYKDKTPAPWKTSGNSSANDNFTAVSGVIPTSENTSEANTDALKSLGIYGQVGKGNKFIAITANGGKEPAMVHIPDPSDPTGQSRVPAKFLGWEHKDGAWEGVFNQTVNKPIEHIATEADRHANPQADYKVGESMVPDMDASGNPKYRKEEKTVRLSENLVREPVGAATGGATVDNIIDQQNLGTKGWTGTGGNAGASSSHKNKAEFKQNAGKGSSRTTTKEAPKKTIAGF
jgi:hypothetical protein